MEKKYMPSGTQAILKAHWAFTLCVALSSCVTVHALQYVKTERYPIFFGDLSPQTFFKEL